MKNNLRNLCEQIQDDILTYAHSDLVSLSMENLDDLCEIVVRNFREFDSSRESPHASNEQSFLIEDVKFDVSGEENEPELQAKLQKEWRGQITPPLHERDIIDYITEKSGWCVDYVSYDTIVPASL